MFGQVGRKWPLVALAWPAFDVKFQESDLDAGDMDIKYSVFVYIRIEFMI